MITTGNAGTKPANVAVKLFYPPSGVYVLPEKVLAPGEQMLLQVGSLIRNQTPDKNGHVLPPDAMEGSYEIQDLNDQGVGYLYEGKLIVDTTYGHATYGCALCCANAATEMLPVSLNGFVGGSGGYTTWSQNSCTNVWTQIPTGNWTSSNSSIASVSFSGSVSFVSPGSTWINSSESLRSGIGGGSCVVTTFYQSAPVNVADFSLSSPQAIMDGQQGAFSVSVTGGTATSYQWSFTAPNGAGDSPIVNFASPTSAQTATDGHWFALPNTACLPSSSYNAVYTINAALTFTGTGVLSKSTTLTINGYWNPAGVTNSPIPNITGGPTIGVNSSGVWYVVNTGNLARLVPTQSTIFVISTSQFYNKTVQHEQVHVNQWIAGTGHLFGDLYSPTDFYNQIKNLTGTSQSNLLNQLVQALQTYLSGQDAIHNSRVPEAEKEAYAVSDPLNPQYLYQNCGRY